MTVTGDGGCPFDWNGLLGGLFRVQVSRLPPLHAYVAVSYRGYWYYIADADLESKATLGVPRGAIQHRDPWRRCRGELTRSDTRRRQVSNRTESERQAGPSLAQSRGGYLFALRARSLFPRLLKLAQQDLEIIEQLLELLSIRLRFRDLPVDLFQDNEPTVRDRGLAPPRASVWIRSASSCRPGRVASGSPPSAPAACE